MERITRLLSCRFGNLEIGSSIGRLWFYGSLIKAIHECFAFLISNARSTLSLNVESTDFFCGFQSWIERLNSSLFGRKSVGSL